MLLPYHNLRVTHWNPGAQKPLILPISVVCNTPDEQIYENISINSRGPYEWVASAPAHDGVAVLCGSGPSLKDGLGEIRAWRAAGAKIFAMNGAARFLAERGVKPDYQVLIDPRPETVRLVGPAGTHLIASQCHPALFDAAANPVLWHLQVENIDDHLPEDQPAHVLIGGAASCGNTATCLVYAKGYRQLELYGYDSSNKGQASHAFRQPMNDGEPMANVDFRGKVYTASLTMKLQAEQFVGRTGPALVGLGCKINVHGDGLLPDMWNAPRGYMSELEKYRMLWGVEYYRAVSPGELTAQKFAEIVEPKGIVIDFGCGTGRGALSIERLTKCRTILVDFADNCRDREAMRLPFVVADLIEPMDVRGDHGFCCDVMEHIPPADVDTVIRNIMACVGDCFFRIDFADDDCGFIIGERLHLSQHDHDWWVAAFHRLGFQVPWSEKHKTMGLFHVVKEAADV